MSANDVNDLVFGIERILAQFVSGLGVRIAALGNVPRELAEVHTLLAAQSTSLYGLGFKIVLVSGITLGAFLMADRLVETRADRANGGHSLLAVGIAAVVALVSGFALTRLLADSGLVVRTLRLWVVVAIVGSLLVFLLRTILLFTVRWEVRHRPIHLVRFTRVLSFAVWWTFAGLGLVATLRLWRVGPGLIDAVGTGLLSIPILVLLVWAVWRYRRTLSGVIAGKQPRSHRLRAFARAWPGIVIGLLIFIFVNTQVAKTLGVALPGMAVLVTVLIIMVTPHLDAMIRRWAQQGLESPHISIAGAAGRQTSRFVMVVITLALLGTFWVIPLAAGLGINLGLVVSDATKVAIIALAAAFLWNMVGTVTTRIARAEREAALGGGALASAPKSRLGTLVPLLGLVSRSTIVAFALLSALVTIGVNVWPLVTGLSFFGLAVGFGSQALVKDVVSGLFFLLDDAFRYGEYIDTSGAKGTVEKISIRSVSLRDSNGSVTTIPYGQMGKIQNFSRDWAVEELSFRVAFDTDTELVRKLFTDIGHKLEKNSEVAPYLLEPLTSQGIIEVDAGTIVVRAKFTAKPGKQSAIRRAVLKAVHEAFRKNGIRASG
jgi:small-conductance mechanosensitive channel